MSQPLLMPIQEFSRLTGISRDSLRHYDKVGLLCPEFRGENNYRYYTDRQIDLAALISGLRVLGVGLEEIKRYADNRSPEKMLDFFLEQDRRIQSEIERLRSLRELLNLRLRLAEEALRYEDNTVVLEEKKREPLFLCPPSAPGGSEAENLVMPYEYAAAHGVNTGFPLGVIVPPDNLETGSWSSPLQYYFKVGKHPNAWKSAGTYAVLYHDLSSTPAEEFYGALGRFLRENGLRPVGAVYEEYPLDELSGRKWQDFRARVEVRVEESGAKKGGGQT